MDNPLRSIRLSGGFASPATRSLDHSECDDDHSGDDWSHWVSIRYNLRED